MPELTPFYERLEPLNRTRIWKDWSGYLVAPKYQHSLATEYYAIRNSVALLDTSPLFKYRITGADAEVFLQYFFARDIRPAKPGSAQYTCWCDEAGYVLQDGVVLRLDKDEFWLTSAEPCLASMRSAAAQQELPSVQIEDISREYGILALQGPNSAKLLNCVCDERQSLQYFKVTRITMGGRSTIVSRTGYTGDLGYEVWISRKDAPAVWDAIWEAGRAFNAMPIGTTALKMARVEAGLLLLDVDFHSARHAWVDAQRETPIELGLGWMFRKLGTDDRQFRGRSAIEQQWTTGTPRWVTVGLNVDWQQYEDLYRDAGIMPPKEDLYYETSLSLFGQKSPQPKYVGYATSFLYSSLLRRPIAIAKVPPALARLGSEVQLEWTVLHRPEHLLARVASMPFFDPPRKKQSTDPSSAAAASRSNSEANHASDANPTDPTRRSPL